MSNRNQHPSVEELTAFNIGLLPPENASLVESHISDCAPCCETLLNLCSDDTFVGMLQKADDPDDEMTKDFSSSEASLASTSSSSDESIKNLFANHPRYEVINRIARGGMGVVFKATHRSMRRTVALKVINQSLIRDSQVVDRFHREVQTAARLSHPNIVTAYDAEQANDNHFLVMEYVDGESLAALVKRDNPIPIQEACQYISQVADGLQYAHGRGVVHRDIKPHNLMLTEGTVKILDFGLASLASLAEAAPAKAEHGQMPEDASLTAACSIMGTPDFMSPEQATDTSRVGFRSDIYSLGATLYYLLAGQPPFSSGSVAQRLESLANSEPTPIQSLRSDVPQGLADVINRMMLKDPDNRFQSAEEVALALEPYIGNTLTGPTVSVQPSLGQGNWWPFNTAKTIAGIAAAFILIFAGVLYVETDKGTLIIKSEDDTVKVVVSQGRNEEGRPYIRTHITDTITGSEVARLPSGEYKLSLASDENKFELNKGGFTLRRGEQVVVTVTRKQTVEANAKAESKTLKKMSLQVSVQQALIRSGSSLSSDDVKKLLAKVDSDTNDIESRLQLLGYYSRRSISKKHLRKPHQELAIWFIRNYPDSATAGDHASHVMGSMNPLGYVKAREIWLEQTNAYDGNVAILMNAADFFLQDDREEAEKLLMKAQALEPDNADVTKKLAQVYQLSGIASGILGKSISESREQNEKAMTQYERALGQIKEGPGRTPLVINIAKTAFQLEQMDKAKNFADRLLKNYSNDGDAVHAGNTLLGLIALKAGEIETANKYLIESGKTKGSPVLGSFGPSMVLANALLEKGQKDTVLKYFELCEKFWNKPFANKLEQWKAAIASDVTPDFGPNLTR